MKVKIKKTRNNHPMPQITEEQLNEVDLGLLADIAQQLSQYSVPDAIMAAQTAAAAGLATAALVIPYIKDAIEGSKEEDEEKSEAVQKIDDILAQANMPTLSSGKQAKDPKQSLEDARARLEKMKKDREKDVAIQRKNQP